MHGLAANKINDLAQEQNAAIYFIIIGLTKTVAQHAVVLVSFTTAAIKPEFINYYESSTCYH